MVDLQGSRHDAAGRFVAGSSVPLAQTGAAIISSFPGCILERSI